MFINQDKNACPYNEGITCGPKDKKGRRVERNCEKCGHNPEVAKARLQEYCEKHNIEFPNVVFTGAE